MKIPEEGTLLRIFIGEADRWKGRPLHAAIVEAARQRGMAGATVTKGMLGFGRNSRMHAANILRLSEDLPVIIELVDSAEKITAFMPELDGMIADGLVTMEPVRVLLYRSEQKA
ncbi:MAG TPA: DUF190 domain-containing protein [Elusimicrobiales bacterium]|nr:DUF190 domain-containing protein [Elusimicrobiales bacterium]